MMDALLREAVLLNMHTGRVIDEITLPSLSTGAEICAKQALSAPRVNGLMNSWANYSQVLNYRSLASLLDSPQQRYADVHEEVLKDRANKNKNNALGEAMHTVKWHGLKHYLTLDHRRKQRMRVRLERDKKARALFDEYRVVLLTSYLETKHE